MGVSIRMGNSSSNPFYFGGAVPPEQFVGRTSEVNELLNRVSRLECVTIFGERRIGKSSVLKYLEFIYRQKVPDPNIRLIMVDLQEPGLATTQAGFLNYVMQAILKYVVWDQLPELRSLDSALKTGKQLTLVEFTDALKRLVNISLCGP